MCETSDRTAGVRTLAVLACAAFIPVFGSCGSESEAPDSLTAAVDTVGGVPRFTYPEEPATVLSWALDTIGVIGGYEQEDGAYQFDEVSPGGVAGDAHNGLFVLDGAGRRVLGYDAAGEPTGVWGREGGGPGEMTAPSGLSVGPADSLWVVDRGNRRVTLFPRDPEGATSEISLTDESSGLGGKLAIGPDGVFGVAMIFSFSPGEEVEYPPRRLIHLQRDGEIADTVWTAPPPSFDRVELTSGDGMAVILTQRTFSSRFHWERFSDGSFAVAQETEYAFSILNGDGSARLHVRRDPPARLTTEEDRQRARDEARADADESTSPFVRNSIDERIDKMTFAEGVPRITGLAVDGNDRLWVGVSEQLPGETERIDVYRLDGSLLGEIRDLGLFPTMFYGTGRAALLDRDELDVQRVVVVELREQTGP